MKSIIISFLFLFSVTSFANPYDFKILRVLDGDTVEFEATFLPPPLKPALRLRVLGVDTPEKGHRAQCPQENELALKATELTKQLVLKAKTRQIIIKEWDKFGGRVLGDLILDGVSLKDSLIKAGLGREYYGEAKQSWCK
jgi:endonuclease YncB( thermonuclease family)